LKASEDLNIRVFPYQRIGLLRLNVLRCWAL